MSTTIRFLILRAEEMLNTKKFMLGRNMEERTSNGRSSTLIASKTNKPRELLKASVSMPTDHSTSDQDFQCKESANLLEPTTLPSRDGERMLLLSNGNSTQT